MSERISIIIPAYNEEKRIARTLEAYGSFFKQLKISKKKLNFEILVVLNGCKDNTLQVVKEFQKKYKEIIFLDFKRVGKGFAITEGFKDALKRPNNLIGFVDADLATSPKSFYDLVLSIGDYDGAIASRGVRGSIVKTSFSRRLTNRGFNLVVRMVLMLPYKDTQCGAKLFRRRALNFFISRWELGEWSFDIDLLYKLNLGGFKIKECPTIWRDIKGSKLDLVKTPFQMFASIIRFRLLQSPFKFIIRVYDKLPERLKIHSW